VKVGVEAAGHYHRPLLGSALWPAGWELSELSPARVSEQRRLQGRRRIKTDAIDLEAITELVLAGHGVAVTTRSATITELSGWAMHRSRRILTRTATKNQLLAQLDRCFPGLTLALPDVLGTRIGRLVAADFADPHRLAALGVTRFVRFAANRGLRVRRSAAERLVAAARTALPAPEAVVAQQVLADDLGLLAELDGQIAAAEAKIAKLLPDTPFAVLLTVPGWGTIRAGNYGAAVGVRIVISNVQRSADAGESGNCTSGYSPCLPPASDYDCAGGSGNGPKYANGPIRVTGSDPYDLDRDGEELDASHNPPGPYQVETKPNAAPAVIAPGSGCRSYRSP